jgi:anti-sigma factor RsiW
MAEAWQSKTCAVTAPLLSALLDGELLLPQRRRVEQHLRACPACALSFEQARLARQALHTLGCRVIAPPELTERLRAELSQSRPARPRWRLPLIAAGGVAALFVLFALLSVLHLESGQRPSALVTRAVAAHRAVEAATTPLALTTSDPAQAAVWVSGVTGRRLDAPSLDDAGYRLLGVRLEPQVAPDGVAMVYAGNDRLLTCVIVPGDRTSGESPDSSAHVHLVDLQGTRVASWQEGAATYLLVADMAPEQLLRVARLAARQDRTPE